MTDPAEGVDVDGYITTGADRANLRSPFLEVVDEAVASCRARCRDDPALYVYGSVATGTAVEGVSDLDLLVVVTSAHDRDVLGGLARELSAKHRDIVREVGLAVATPDEVVADSDEGIAWRCFVKHYCVCVDGVDLAADLPRCRPSSALARGFAAGTEAVVQDVADRLPEASDAEVGVLARRAARRLLLAGAVTASIAAGTWTTSRDRAVDLLAARHPRWRDELQRAARWADPLHLPAVTREELERFLDEFGGWLLRHVDQVTADDEDEGGP